MRANRPGCAEPEAGAGFPAGCGETSTSGNWSVRAEACWTRAGSLPESFPGPGRCRECVSAWPGQALVLPRRRARGGRGLGWPPAQALDRSRMVKAKVPASKGAPSRPVAKPGPVKTLTRKKNKKKKRFWKSKAQEVSKKPGSGPGVVVRPPKAPEDFSQNWKALQEVRLEGTRAERGAAHSRRTRRRERLG